MKALSVTVFKSIGQGLNAANKVGSFVGLELLECTPQDGQLLLIVDGVPDKLSEFHQSVCSLGPVKEHFFEALNSKVWQAHLSLTNSNVKKFVYVIETGVFGDLLRAVDSFFKSGADCIDLRAARGSSRTNYALMTSDQSISTNEVGAPVSATVTVVSDVSPALRNFLDLRPNKA